MTAAGSDGPFFTLFIPSYNRAASLIHTLESVERSSCRDMEVLLVDDGSTDETKELVDRWRTRAAFETVYIYQENKGKIGAHNTALEKARGQLFITLDAGDLLLPGGLKKIKDRWEEIPTELKSELAGIGALCVREDGLIAGKKYPEDGVVANYLEMLSITGEKRFSIRTAVMKQYPYPTIAGEKHIRPDVILKRMAHDYNLLFTNIHVQVNVREQDGITANIYRYRMNNPKGFHLYFLEDIALHSRYFTRRKLYGAHWRYVQYSLHSGISLLQQGKEIGFTWLWFISIPMGTIKWLSDKYRQSSGISNSS